LNMVSCHKITQNSGISSRNGAELHIHIIVLRRFIAAFSGIGAQSFWENSPGGNKLSVFAFN